MGLLVSIKALGGPRKGELEHAGRRETCFEGLCDQQKGLLLSNQIYIACNNLNGSIVNIEPSIAGFSKLIWLDGLERASTRHE